MRFDERTTTTQCLCRINTIVVSHFLFVCVCVSFLSYIAVVCQKHKDNRMCCFIFSSVSFFFFDSIRLCSHLVCRLHDGQGLNGPNARFFFYIQWKFKWLDFYVIQFYAMYGIHTHRSTMRSIKEAFGVRFFSLIEIDLDNNDRKTVSKGK